MASGLKQFKARALARTDVKKLYDELAEEFAFLDEVLKARIESGLTQSAIARLESAESKHSPSIATLQKYAKALGYKVAGYLIPHFEIGD